MREILFRGKAKRFLGLPWVEGYFMDILGNGTPYIATIAPIKDDEEAIINGEIVIPETVGQYTGLTDKNGKKIFEGDIVRHHNDCPDSESKEKGVVFWDEKYCSWRRTSNGAFHHGIVDTYRMSHNCVYEVIGNIHDNPELLKEGAADE